MREPRVAVRPGRPADLDALVVLEEATFAQDRTERRAFRHALGSPSMSMLVAEAGGELVGYAMTERRRGSTLARLTSIAVRPDRAGSGLGRILLEAMQADALAHGCDRLRLEVRPDNTAAQRLYERVGYRRFATVEDYYEDGAPAWRYEKSLP